MHDLLADLLDPADYAAWLLRYAALARRLAGSTRTQRPRGAPASGDGPRCPRERPGGEQ